MIWESASRTGMKKSPVVLESGRRGATHVQPRGIIPADPSMDDGRLFISACRAKNRIALLILGGQ